MRRTRLGLVAAAGTAALALSVSGCGGGSDTGDGSKDGGDGKESSSSGSGSSSGGDKDEGGPDDGGPGGSDSGGSDGGSGGSSGGSGEGGKDAAAPFQGPWASGMKSDGGKLMVLIFNGTEVSLAGPDVACQGKLEAGDGPAKLGMKCRDSNDEYASGTITRIDGKGLTVKWGSGETSEFLKGAAPAGPPEE